MNFFQWHIGDYRSHTSHLSLEEDMAYRRLLELYYLHEGPINGRSTDVQRDLNGRSTDDKQSLNEMAADVARLINMRDNVSAVATVISEFFVFVPGEGWRNKRADEEISRYLKKTKQASKAGKRSAEIRGQRTFNGRSTDVQRDLNGRSTTMTMTMTKKEDTSETQINPETIAQPEKITPDVFPLKADFESWWGLYPRKIGKGQARRAFVAARKKTDQEALVSGLRGYLKNLPADPKFIPHPSTWLNGERWADDNRAARAQTLTQKILSSSVPG